MAHNTAFGRSFFANPVNAGALINGHGPSGVPQGGPQFPSIVFDPLIDLFTDCPLGQVKIPFTDICVDIPFIPDPTGNGCDPGFVSDGMGGCVPSDPTGPPISPGERGAVASGPALPSRVARNVHVCPKFVDGSTGILYFNPLTNQVVCLPRSMSPKAAMAFGLLRKNKPRAKALVTAADGRLLSKISSIQGKIGTLAAKAEGLGCPKKKR